MFFSSINLHVDIRMVSFQGSFRNIIPFASESHSYGWWKKSCTSWYPFFTGFFASQVVVWDFWTINSIIPFASDSNHIHIFMYVQVSPDAKVSVKLVANAGIGTIAAGVAKVGPVEGLLLGVLVLFEICMFMYFTDMNEWSKTCILYNEFVDVDIGSIPHKHMQFTDMITQDFGRGWVGFFENVTKRGPTRWI